MCVYPCHRERGNSQTHRSVLLCDSHRTSKTDQRCFACRDFHFGQGESGSESEGEREGETERERERESERASRSSPWVPWLVAQVAAIPINHARTAQEIDLPGKTIELLPASRRANCTHRKEVLKPKPPSKGTVCFRNQSGGLRKSFSVVCQVGFLGWIGKIQCLGCIQSHCTCNARPCV